MSIEVGLWKLLGRSAIPMPASRMPTEQLLEDALVDDISVLDSSLFVLGRQFQTPNRKRLDILAIAGDGSLSVIELKRHQTEREVVSQALDYGSWAQTLTRDDLITMYADRNSGADLDADFLDFFGIALPEELDGEHRLLIVASGLDEETERIVNYLASFDVPINAVFFKYFEQNDDRFLARTWLRDPEEVDAASSTTSASKRNYGAWNGSDFYVSFESNADREWEDARTYGFVSAGGRRWYTRTMHNLEEGHRVFVRIPHEGYVGIGIVKQAARLARDVDVKTPHGPTPLLEADLAATTTTTSMTPITASRSFSLTGSTRSREATPFTAPACSATKTAPAGFATSKPSKR